ncbi:MAG: hypothetical protein KOO60_07480 [Gemmatimonadales bacterium]|nr:hypothetical protein [Gemmatimonadales bacterium]
MVNALFRDGFVSTGGGMATRRVLGGGGGEIKMAQCRESAPADEFISVKLLDSDLSETGDAFDVTCRFANRIAGAGALNEALPRLVSGDYIPIVNISGTWTCTTIFQDTEDCDCYTAP